MRQGAAEHAYRVVQRLQRDVFTMVRATIRQPWRYARTVVAQDDAFADQQTFDQAIRKAVGEQDFRTVAALQSTGTTTFAEDLIQMARWQRNRTVYTVHPETLAALLDTDWKNTIIPGEVLTRLPHPDVLVVLPEPIRWQNNDGAWETYEAFGVFGVRPPRRRCSSHDPEVTHLVLHYFGRVTDEHGTPLLFDFPDFTSPGTVRRVPQFLGCRAVVDVGVDGTMEEREAQAVSDMFSGGPSAVIGFGSADEAAKGMSLLTQTGLAILTYIASDNLDIESSPSPGRRNRKRRVSGEEGVEEPKVWRVGFKIGAALTRASAGTASRKPGSVSSGRTVAPHVRRAHLHTFRRGPGRQERFVKWLPPLAVNAEGKKPDSKTVSIHEVR